MSIKRWNRVSDPDKIENAYECFLTEYGDEHGFSDEQMNEFVMELRHQEGEYALHQQYESITDMESDMCRYWKYHSESPYDPFIETYS